MVKFRRMGLLSALIPPTLVSLSPRAWPNPEAQRQCSISVTFDGPGLKQISIPLVDFKRRLNNDASQRRVNEACSGLATSDFKINLIRGRDIISVPPSSFFLPCYLDARLPFPSPHYIFFASILLSFSSLLIFSSLFSNLLLFLSPSLPFTAAP